MELDLDLIRYRINEYLRGNWLLLIVSFVLSLTLSIILIDLVNRVVELENLLTINDLTTLIKIGSLVLITFIISDFFYQNFKLFNLKVLYRKLSSNDERLDIAELFKGQYHWKLLCLVVVKAFLILLWSLLLIVPGIVKSYQYSLSSNIILDQPNTNIVNALKESKRLMIGQVFNYFKIQIRYNWAYLIPIFLFVAFVLSNFDNVIIAEEMGNEFISLVYGMLTGVVALIILSLFLMSLYIEPKKAMLKQTFYYHLVNGES